MIGAAAANQYRRGIGYTMRPPPRYYDWDEVKQNAWGDWELKDDLEMQLDEPQTPYFDDPDTVRAPPRRGVRTRAQARLDYDQEFRNQLVRRAIEAGEYAAQASDYRPQGKKKVKVEEKHKLGTKHKYRKKNKSNWYKGKKKQKISGWWVKRAKVKSKKSKTYWK